MTTSPTSQYLQSVSRVLITDTGVHGKQAAYFECRAMFFFSIDFADSPQCLFLFTTSFCYLNY